jgi:hypothetical protein
VPAAPARPAFLSLIIYNFTPPAQCALRLSFDTVPAGISAAWCGFDLIPCRQARLLPGAALI